MDKGNHGAVDWCKTLRRHLNVMGLNNDPSFRFCEGREESSLHLLCYCDTLMRVRFEIVWVG